MLQDIDLQYSGGIPTFTGPAAATALSASGLTGATAASRYVGATASGAPVSGTFAVGDFVIDQTGKSWICTVAGTQGTWVQGGTVTSVTAADTSVVTGGTSAAPTVRTGTLDVIAAQHPAAADWSNNSHKITSLANGSGAQDAAAYGQTPAGGNTVTIGQGGTGQVTAAAAYNALSPMTTTGDIEYESGAGAASRLAGNTTSTKNFLSSTGTGSAAQAPAWGTIAAADLPAATTSAQGAVQLDGTASDIKPTGTASSAGVSGKAPAADHVHPVPLWTPADQGLLAWNYDIGSAASGGSTALATAGTLYVMALPVRAAISVTNILAVLTVNGGTLTSGQCFAALYQGAAGSLIGTSADQASAWGAGATKLVTMALSGGPFTVQPGIAYVALWFNGTTGPTLYKTVSSSVTANLSLAAASSRFGTADTGKTTTAPLTLGTISAASNGYWVALS